MVTRKAAQISTSEREKQHQQMLEAAISRPGIREIMEVYGNWEEKDRGLEAYRSVTKQRGYITTTSSSTAS